jgi:bifunctional non-homologous end joining protein LigD
MVYCAHITTGFSERNRRVLYECLSQIGCADPPFTNIDSQAFGSQVRWVLPLLVGRVEYREFTGRLRHAAWKGIDQADPSTVHLPPRR